ncbi:MAG: heavy-metal-associated domain-containing protein [Sedimenticola sp.]|nr:heavy-metal-associated domain-containing protein [Sedimenticola sp.]
MSRDQFIRMRGAWDTRHWINVPGLAHEADGMKLREQLGEITGVGGVECYPAKRRVRITYDQTRVDYHTLLQNLEALGFPASGGWWARQKGAWFQYLDRNARENANVPEPPCCSNPRGISGNRGRKS